MMTESGPILDPQNFLRRKNDRFERHVTDELASLRAAFDIQFKRIAQLEAELSLLSAAGKPHESLARGCCPAKGGKLWYTCDETATLEYLETFRGDPRLTHLS